MEKKTIGGFIAALRKVNGMTQKELAERLNVSDKTVSRWERDDGAPDLSLIPVIAEIFEVTCDELLRGERKSPAWRLRESTEMCDRQQGDTGQDSAGQEYAGRNDTAQDPAQQKDRSQEGAQYILSAKGKKERQRLLAVGLFKYRTRTCVAAGLALLGLIAAMIGNFGFTAGRIGFLTGAVFYLASVVCQIIFINSAFFTVTGAELEDRETGRFKYTVSILGQWSLGLTVFLTAFSLPLMVFLSGRYVGLTAGSWFGNGLLFGGLALVVYGVLCYFVNSAMLRRGVYQLEEKKQQILLYNRRLKKKCGGWTLAAVVVTLVIHVFVYETPFLRWSLTEEIRFEDYESFVAYMEQEVAYEPMRGTGGSSVIPVPPAAEAPVASEQGATAYYDQEGNVISQEEALRRELTDIDGNVVCEYISRNESVSGLRYSYNEEGQPLPIIVDTYEMLESAQRKMELIYAGFVLLYGLELLTGTAVYLRRRKSQSI